MFLLIEVGQVLIPKPLFLEVKKVTRSPRTENISNIVFLHMNYLFTSKYTFFKITKLNFYTVQGSHNSHLKYFVHAITCQKMNILFFYGQHLPIYDTLYFMNFRRFLALTKKRVSGAEKC